MKIDHKGQALIEFVIILPVLIMIIFSFIDFGKIILENNRLESLSAVVISKYVETKNYDEVLDYIEELGYENIDLSVKTSGNILTIKLNKEIDFVTPGLSNILGNPYYISVERVVGYEK